MNMAFLQYESSYVASVQQQHNISCHTDNMHMAFHQYESSYVPSVD